MPSSNTAGGSRRTHRLLLVLPFIWQAGLAPAINNVGWTPFGLPFPMVWQIVGIVLTSIVIWVVYTVDQSLGEEEDATGQANMDSHINGGAE